MCFGSTSTTCPANNLYRIIGVFDGQVKLIKNTSIGYYEWDTGGDNIWSSSNIKNVLNNTFLQTFSSTWQGKIATHAWKVGGVDDGDGLDRPFRVYEYEVGSRSSSTTWSGKIGLMYANDYGFAASPTYWSTDLGEYDTVTSYNWLYLGDYEWLITPSTHYSNVALVIYGAGDVVDIYGVGNEDTATRPAFYLNSNVTYSSGDGTQSNPFRIG